MNHAAYISEIFSSIQGEGPHTGEKMTFVRFAGCSLGCRYCDTPGGICSRGSFTIEEPPGSARFDVRPNPTGAAALCDILASFDDDTVAVTGGEPLEQSEFLAEWLPSVFHSRRVLLETNGVHAEALGLVAPSVHIISMDIKLPSSSGVGPLWKEHGAFLEKAASSGKEIYVKIVVTSKTNDR
nr:7-carboxy-7-deazaguanine synthase QueE [bacterium]